MGDFFDNDFFGIEQLLMEENITDETDSEEGETQQHAHDNAEGNQEQDPNLNHQEQLPNRGGRQLTLQQRRLLADELLKSMEEGKLPWGYLTKLAEKHGLHRTTTARLWNKMKQQLAHGNVIDVRSNKLGTVGKKQMHFSDEFLQSVPLYLRTTERSYANALKISHVTLHNLKRRGRLRTHTSSNHPALTSNHKIARLKWVLGNINPTPQYGNPIFKDLQSVIHIDEKWFYLNPETRRFYLLPKEEDPYRAQQSRRFKVKAMFEGMIGKPLYDSDGVLLHSGKYGIFPFVVKQQAKKKSKNRAAGTWETKAVQSVTKESIRSMLLDNIIPTLHAQWPDSLPKDVIIQWDNAKPHQLPTDEEFWAACNANGFNIQIVHQPPQSPDLNVLDLGLFRVIQSLQYQSFPKTLDELIENVKEAYRQFSPTLSKYTWITLQSCMTEILKKEGGNNYKTPHMGKAKLDILGQLPQILEVDREVVREAVHYLDTLFINAEGVLVDETQVEMDAD